VIQITEQQMRSLFPKCKNVKEYVNAINQLLPKYGINASIPRLATFLGQFGHETMGWTRLVENTNYTSPERLMRVFPSRFPTLYLAKMYVNKPINIANRVYANRYGNGDEASGDGWRYRGRGGCHLTFKDNYIAFYKATGVDVVQHPEFLEEGWYAVLSACWYWDSRKINALVDKNDWWGVTKAINGPSGMGHEEREKGRKAAMEILTKKET